MPVSQTTRVAAQAKIAALAATPERSIAERLADIFVENEEDGHVTLRSDLHRSGFTDAEIDANQVEAVYIAGRRRAETRARDIQTPRQKSLEEIAGDMSDVIASLLPPTQLLVAELQGRGFASGEIDLLLPKARAKAALSFAEGQTGWAN